MSYAGAPNGFPASDTAGMSRNGGENHWRQGFASEEGQAVRFGRFVFTLLFLVGLSAFAQEVDGPHDPWAWRESFMHFERLEPATTQDFGLNGPVESVTVHSYYLDPESEPQVRPAVSRGNPVHTRQLFDERGYLRESQYISSAGEAGLRYRYEFEEDFYLGFTELRHSGSVLNSFRRRRVSDELVVAVWDTLDSIKSGEYRYHYDENGRLIRVEHYSLDAPERLLERNSYRYEGDLLAETQWTNGDETRTVAYEYRPHPLVEGELLLAEQNGYSDADLLTGRLGEEQVNRNPDHQDLLRSRTLSYYYPDARLAKRHHVRISYPEFGVRQETLMRMEEFEDGKLVREIDGPASGHVINSVRTYVYGADGRLVGEIRHPSAYASRDPNSIGLCEYRGFDEHGNWTEYVCAYSLERSENLQLPEAFQGQLITRDITYHQ
jgi:hypothetical protein